MKCKICGSDSELAFEAAVMGHYHGRFSRCRTCGFLQADNPDWLEAAYREPINLTDTGLVKRNLLLSRVTAAVIFYLFDHKPDTAFCWHNLTHPSSPIKQKMAQSP